MTRYVRCCRTGTAALCGGKSRPISPAIRFSPCLRWAASLQDGARAPAQGIHPFRPEDPVLWLLSQVWAHPCPEGTLMTLHELHYTSVNAGPGGSSGFQFMKLTDGVDSGLCRQVEPLLGYEPPRGSPARPRRKTSQSSRWPLAMRCFLRAGLSCATPPIRESTTPAATATSTRTPCTCTAALMT